MKWKAGLKVFVVLALIFAAQSRLIAYVLQEAFVIVLGTAVLLLLILLPLISFLLLWEGASIVFLRLTSLVNRITGVRDRPLALNKR